MARCQKIVTGTGTVTPVLLAGGSASIFYGLSATSTGNAAPYYIKIYWEGNGVSQTVATTTPSVATTVPQLTIPVNYTAAANGNSALFFNNVPLDNGGRMWYWISVTLADATAQSALVMGGDVVTLIYD